MPVSHARKRALSKMGGGISEPSLTDTATDNDIMQHDNGADPAGVVATASLDYDEDYGYAGLKTDHADPYTFAEALHDMEDFGAPSFETSTQTRDVAEVWEVGTVTLQPNAEPYCISGADPLRKSIVVTNVTSDAAINTGNVYFGKRSVSANGGSVSYLLRSALAAFPVYQSSPVMTHNEEVWVIPATGNTAAVTVTYMVERYQK